MIKKSRILFAIAAVVLILAYFFPMWSISLDAPQYPEGIGMYIWLHTISGHKKHDLQNINGLNHYIGMKEIHPESIAELKLMPYIIGFFIVLGLIGAFSGKKILLVLWIILFIAVSVGGIVDFYLWEYDYGHNLNPDAAIKIPGMSYQPPLIGYKQLLNMRVTSYPAIGGLAVVFSILLGIAAFWLDRRGQPE